MNSMTAEKILDHNKDLDLTEYDQIRIVIGAQRFRISPRFNKGILEISTDGRLHIDPVASNWIEVTGER